MSGAQLHVSAITHTGLVRDSNEDSYAVTGLRSSRRDGDVVSSHQDGDSCLAIVADGLGGHPRGDLASSLVVEHVLNTNPNEPAALVAAAHTANDALFDAMRSDPTRGSMGSTIAAALVRAGRVAVVNVGDSSVFEFAHNRLHELTASHALAAVAMLPGLSSGRLTQALGGALLHRPIEPHVYEDGIPAAWRILLCTDGLTSFVPHHEITSVLRRYNGAEAVTELVSLALDAGGADNVTVVLLEASQGRLVS